MLIPYDLHIHTCLSPCGDDEMTPINIANMACLKGLRLIAVTDHNSARNVAAVIEAAADLPLTVIPGLELNTSEEIHIVCLFPDAASAEKAGEFVEDSLPPVLNKPEVFGSQFIMDKSENIVGEVPQLLITASTISVDDVGDFIAGYGGICFPAHIDRSSNSIIEVFGAVPDYLGFMAVEVSDPDAFLSSTSGRDICNRYRVLTNSDAHYLQNIAETERFLELPGTGFDDLKRCF